MYYVRGRLLNRASGGKPFSKWVTVLLGVWGYCRMQVSMHRASKYVSFIMFLTPVLNLTHSVTL